MRRTPLPLVPVALALGLAAGSSLLACSGKHDDPASPTAAPTAKPTASGSGTPPPLAVPYDQPGPFAVGHTSFVVTDVARARTLRLSLWYPAAESGRAAASAGTAIEDLVPPGPDHDAFAALVAKAPAPCTSRTTRSAEGIDPAPGGRLPLVAFSHCHSCLRFEAFTLAEQLASRGMLVVAPDHAGNTLFDDLAGHSAAISPEFLAVRSGDVRFALDAVLDDASSAVPQALRGRADVSRVGVFGHSYGAATAGQVLQDDPRPRAGLAIAAPMESPLLPGVMMSNIHAPVFFLLAREDHSITEIGNGFIRQNFNDAPGHAFLAEVSDAGHWSFSDICALEPIFGAGCGSSKRQTPPYAPFTYLANEAARALAGGYVAAFFSLELLGDAPAEAYLSAPHPAGVVAVMNR